MYKMIKKKKFGVHINEEKVKNKAKLFLTSLITSQFSKHKPYYYNLLQNYLNLQNDKTKLYFQSSIQKGVEGEAIKDKM